MSYGARSGSQYLSVITNDVPCSDDHITLCSYSVRTSLAVELDAFRDQVFGPGVGLLTEDQPTNSSMRENLQVRMTRTQRQVALQSAYR